MGGLDPHTGYLGVHVLGAERGVIMVTASDRLVRHQLAVHDEHAGGLVGGQRQRFIQQRLVGHAFA